MSKADVLRLSDYLEHILEAIERIDSYLTDTDEVAFLNDRKTQDAVIRNFEIIGEAAHNIESCHAAFATAHPDIPWAVRVCHAQPRCARLFQSGFGNGLENHPH